MRSFDVWQIFMIGFVAGGLLTLGIIYAEARYIDRKRRIR